MKTSKTITGKYLILEELDNGLRVTLTGEGRDELGDRNYDIDYAVFADLFDDIQANSDWEMLSAEEIGALTGCELIISKEVERDDWGDIKLCNVVYWHERYAVENFIEELLAGNGFLPKGY